MNKLSLSNYTELQLIGSGSFGEVYKIQENRTKQIYAAKVSKISLSQANDDYKKNLIREIKIISKIHHPSIIKLIGLSFTNFHGEEKPVIVTDFISNGSLQVILNKCFNSLSPTEWNDTNKLRILYGIANAMSYLHSHDIIHRDLKPDNILIDQFLRPILTDFGLAKFDKKNSSTIEVKGTPIYIAPEIWKDSEYTKEGDVYAFGIITYTIYANEQPYKNFNSNLIKEFVCNGKRPDISLIVGYDFIKKLIESCWSQIPSNRPTFDQIMIQLEQDEEFITEFVDEEKYKSYIAYIKECSHAFDTKSPILEITQYNLLFKYLKTNQTASIIKSPKVTNEIYIPSHTYNKCKKYNITSISDMAFSGLSLETLVFSDDSHIEKIGNSSFENNHIQKLSFPASLKNLDSNCFLRSELLSTVKFKSKELHIGYNCFSNCSSLQAITFENAKKIILNIQSFKDCSNLKEILINDKSKSNTDKKFIARDVDEIIVLKECLMNCPLIKTVLFTNVKKVSLNSQAFGGCSNLHSIIIKGSKDIKIDHECFSESECLTLLEFTSISISLEKHFIANCTSLTHIIISCHNDLNIHSDTFEGCKSIINLKLSTLSTLKLESNCLKDLINLQNIELESSVLDIRDDCFNNCLVLKFITIKTESDATFHENFLSECEYIENITITSKSTLNLGKKFLNESKVKNVYIEGKEIFIEDNCFNNCPLLNYFTIAHFRNVEIGKKLFSNCEKLENIIIKELKENENEDFTIYELNHRLLFEVKKLRNLMFIGGKVVIKNIKFKEFSNLESIIMANMDSVYIGEYQFSNCKSLKNVSIECTNNIKIDDYSFQGSDKIGKIKLSSKYISIFNFCFHNCSSLRTIDLFSTEKLFLGFRAFCKIKNFCDININSHNELKIDNECFYESSIQTVVIRGKTISIGTKCFSKSSIKSLTILSDDNITLDNSAYEDCKKLEIVKLHSTNHIEIFEFCFCNAINLISLEIFGKYVFAGKSCFENCKSIEYLSIPNSYKVEFAQNAFLGCKNIVQIEIISLQEFKAGDCCFSNESKIRFFSVNSKKVFIGELCFNRCPLLDTISLPTANEITYFELSFNETKVNKLNCSTNVKIIQQKSKLAYIV